MQGCSLLRMDLTTNPKEHWLNANRLRVYPCILLLVFASTCAFWMLASKNMIDGSGNPFGSDFITFWAASAAGLQGHAPDAYNAQRILHFEQMAAPASKHIFGWFYPPSFYLLILPLAWLPYPAAYWVWIFSTLAFFVFVLRRIVKDSTAMVCLAAFSGMWLNFVDGQNASLTAGLAGAAILCLKRRPYLAGVFIGLLTIKPHLALLFPVALIAVRAWKPLVSAAATTLALLAAGTAVLGQATLKAWLGSVGLATLLLERGGLPWEKMPTVFAMARMFGAPARAAYSLHAVVAVAAIAAVCWVWRQSADWELRGAALMSATFLLSPYVFDYDLTWLAFPIAWLCVEGLRDGWLRGEREVLIAAWILPLMSTDIASAIRVQVGPLVVMALLWVVLRRVAGERVVVLQAEAAELVGTMV
jgi:hypothetical protein